MANSIWTDEDIPITTAPKKSSIWTDEDIPITSTPQTSRTNGRITNNANKVISGIKEVLKVIPRGVGNVVDAPFAIYDLAATGNNWVADKTKDINPLAMHAPVSNFRPGESLLNAFQNKTGYNLKPNKDNAFNRFVGTVGDWMLPSAIFGGAGKVAKGANSLMKVSQGATQGAKTGAKLGAVSAGLQELGVDPLHADIATIVGVPSVAGISKAANAVTKRGVAALKGVPTEDKAAQILRREIGEGNVNPVISALTTQKAPFGAPLSTAEMSFDLAKGEKPNAGLSRLHRAFAPNSNVITNNALLADEAVNASLHGIGDPLSLPTGIGDTIRNKITTNYDRAVSNRATQTKPLYEKLYASQDKVTPYEAYQYIDQFYNPNQLATGELKSLLDYFNRNLGRTTTKPKAYKGEKFARELRDVSPPNIQAQIDAALAKGTLPRPAKTPGEIDSFIQGTINPKLDAYSTQGGTLLHHTKKLKKSLENALSNTEASKKYAELSKDVNAIEQNNLLGKIIKQDQFKQDYILPSEMIGQKILSSSTKDTKSLVKQLKGDPQALEAVRSTYVGHLFGGKEKLTYDRIRGFNHKYREKLPEVFAKEQVQVLDNAEELLHRRHLVQNVGRAVGSNTQSETTLLNDLFSNAGNSVIKTMLNKVPGGKILYNNTIENISRNRELAVKAVLEQALADPQFAAMLLKRPQEVPLSSIQDALKQISKEYGKDLTNPVNAYIVTKDRDKK